MAQALATSSSECWVIPHAAAPSTGVACADLMCAAMVVSFAWRRKDKDTSLRGDTEISKHHKRSVTGNDGRISIPMARTYRMTFLAGSRVDCLLANAT